MFWLGRCRLGGGTCGFQCVQQHCVADSCWIISSWSRLVHRHGGTTAPHAKGQQTSLLSNNREFDQPLTWLGCIFITHLLYTQYSFGGFGGIVWRPEQKNLRIAVDCGVLLCRYLRTPKPAMAARAFDSLECMSGRRPFLQVLP